jgi:hypothetical protein
MSKQAKTTKKRLLFKFPYAIIYRAYVCVGVLSLD